MACYFSSDAAKNDANFTAPTAAASGAAVAAVAVAAVAVAAVAAVAGMGAAVGGGGLRLTATLLSN